VDPVLPHVAVIRDWLGRGVLGDVVAVTADHASGSLRMPSSGCSHRNWAAARCWTSALSRVVRVDGLGTPSRIVSLSELAFTVWTRRRPCCSATTAAPRPCDVHSRAKSPTTAANRRQRRENPRSRATSTLQRPSRSYERGRPGPVESGAGGRGLHHQADEVARRLDAGRGKLVECR